MFPIKNYKYEIPQGNHLGAFGTIRKHDIHTGIDLYCEKDTPIYAIAIKSKSGTLNYGELIPLESLQIGDTVKEGDLIGHVTPVLKQ